MIEISTQLPEPYRSALVDAGRRKSMPDINSLHRQAREMYPKKFRRDDDSNAVKSNIMAGGIK